MTHSGKVTVSIPIPDGSFLPIEFDFTTGDTPPTNKLHAQPAIIFGTNKSTQIKIVPTPLPIIKPHEAKPFNTAAPKVTGNTKVGSVLTVTDGEWNGDPTEFHLQWEWED